MLSRLVGCLLRLPAALDGAVTVERDLRIPMDDGAQLVADVYTPPGTGSHPTVLVRSPYGRRGPLGFVLGRMFAERGYRVVMQSCRGTFGSGGVFEPHFHERSDGLATIRWIERQGWFDGRLAMNGPSYLGDVQWAVADSAGPSLRALCTHVTYSNIARHWYRGGSFSLEDAIEWTTMVSEQERGLVRTITAFLDTRTRRIDRAVNGLPVAKLDELVIGRPVPFWRDLVEHASCDDPFWAPVDYSARVGRVAAPVLQVGGWYDIFLPIQLGDYRTLVASGNQPRLVIGPWTHASPRGFAAQGRESLRWLDRNVRDRPQHAGDTESPPVRIFVMGTNEWRDLGAWPPPGSSAQRWHLHPGGRLDPADPPDSEPDRYVYDPARPTPVVGGTLLRRSGGRRNQAGTEARPDVTVFTSDALTRDIEIIGEVSAEIYVSSDLQHFDVFVRLCHVDEKGRSYNVCDGVERVSPTRGVRTDDGSWVVRVELWPTAERVPAGHRVRVQVASGAHPRFARNLGTGEPLATGTAMRTAHQSIHHDPEHRSAIVLPVETGTGSH